MVSLIPLTVFRINFMFSSLLMESTHCVTRCLRSICVLLRKALSKRHALAVRATLAIRTRRRGHILQQRSLVCGIVGGHKLRLELKHLVHVAVSQRRCSLASQFSVITLCNKLLTVRCKGLFLDEVLLVGSQGFNLLLHLCQLVSLFLRGVLVIGALCLELLLVLGCFTVGFRHGVAQLLHLCARVCNLFKRRNDFIGGHALFVGITEQHIEFHIVNFLLRFFTVASLQRCEICIPASLPEYISPLMRIDSELCTQQIVCVRLGNEVFNCGIFPSAIHKTTYQAFHRLNCPKFFLRKAIAQIIRRFDLIFFTKLRSVHSKQNFVNDIGIRGVRMTVHPLIFGGLLQSLCKSLPNSNAFFAFNQFSAQCAFHCVKLFDIRFLKSHCQFASVSHRKENESIPCHKKHRLLLSLRIFIRGLHEIVQSKFFGASDFTNVLKNTAMLFPKCFSNI
nr:MAG TPA: hypothetical protein [Caudoviricetes sp.]